VFFSQVNLYVVVKAPCVLRDLLTRHIVRWLARSADVLVWVQSLHSSSSAVQLGLNGNRLWGLEVDRTGSGAFPATCFCFRSAESAVHTTRELINEIDLRKTGF